MGHGSERHDTHSYEQYDGQWIGVPPARAARGPGTARARRSPTPAQVNPGEVWEENEFWIELSWRIDPDGSLGHPPVLRVRRAGPGEKLTVDEYYGWMFEHSVPGLPERAAAEGLTPLEWMRRYGAFEISRGQGAVHEQEVPPEELADAHPGPSGRVYTAAPPPDGPQHRAVRRAGARRRQGGGRPGSWSTGSSGAASRPRPGGWSSGPRPSPAWGWPEHALPGYIRSHVHPVDAGR